MCPLRKLKLPSQLVHWHKIGAPAAPTKIFLGEADAATWAAEDRLRRSSDDGCRFVRPMDSASCVGAFMKGRSASRLLNTRCQRLCAIGISGGHEVFYPWIPSGENPADEPSRRFEAGLDLPSGPPCDRENVLLSAPPLDDSKAELEGKEVVIVDPFIHGRLQSKEAFFVHLCSGPFREDDLTAWVERLGHEHGMLIVGIRVDPRVRKSSHSLDLACNDMFKTADMLLLLSLIHAGRVQGLFVSPPCSTFSAARHKALSGKKHGPRPLRSRRNPWVCLPGRTKREHEAVDIGTGLGLLSIGLMGEARMFGAWVGGEHPADRCRAPFPSLFANQEMDMLKSTAKLKYCETDQCMFGASSRKPTGLVLPHGHQSIMKTCNHKGKHDILAGWDSKQMQFRTTAAAQYPTGFSHAIALLFVNRILHASQHGYQQPYRPFGMADHDHVEPWTGAVRTAWKWPSPSRGFLAECIERCNQKQIRASNSNPQW